jgi:hypothetical protein
MILRQGSCPKHEKTVCLKSFSCGGAERTEDYGKIVGFQRQALEPTENSDEPNLTKTKDITKHITLIFLLYKKMPVAMKQFYLVVERTSDRSPF